MAAILKLNIPDTGKLVGRVLTEAMPNGKKPQWRITRQVSTPDAAGNRTIVQTQIVADSEMRYFDAAGYEGRTVGLTAPEASQRAGE